MAYNPTNLALRGAVSTQAKPLLADCDALVPVGGELWIETNPTVSSDLTLTASRLKDGGGFITVSDPATLTLNGKVDETLRFNCPSSFNLNSQISGYSGNAVCWIQNNLSLPNGCRVTGSASIQTGTTVSSTSSFTKTVTGTTALNSKTITSVSDTTGLYLGMLIAGSGIPFNTVISGWDASTITISRYATASATVSLTITGNMVTLSLPLTGDLGWSPTNFTKGGRVSFQSGSGKLFLQQFIQPTDTNATNAFHAAVNADNASISHGEIYLGRGSFTVTDDICPSINTIISGVSEFDTILTFQGAKCVYGLLQTLPASNLRAGGIRNLQIQATDGLACTQSVYSMLGQNITRPEILKARLGPNASGGRVLYMGALGAGASLVTTDPRRSRGPILIRMDQVLMSGGGGANLPQVSFDGITTLDWTGCQVGGGATGCLWGMWIDDSPVTTIDNGSCGSTGVALQMEGLGLDRTRGCGAGLIANLDSENPIVQGSGSPPSTSWFMSFGYGWLSTDPINAAINNLTLLNLNLAAGNAVDGSGSAVLKFNSCSGLVIDNCKLPEGYGASAVIWLEGTTCAGFTVRPNPRVANALFTTTPSYIQWNGFTVNANPGLPWDTIGYTDTYGYVDTATGTITLKPNTAPTSNTNWIGARLTILTGSLSNNLTVNLDTASKWPGVYRRVINSCTLNGHTVTSNGKALALNQFIEWLSDGTSWVQTDFGTRT